jgi:glycosyltransferase involved in cell wall biosynthesis
VKILYLCPDSGVALTRYNGSAIHLRSIVEAFRELGHEVSVLMSGVEGSEQLGVRVRSIPRFDFARSATQTAARLDGSPADREKTTSVLRALRRIWSNSAVEQALSEEIAERRPDLIYERYSPFCASGPLTAHRLGCPHVLEVNAPLAWEGARHRGQALNEGAEVLECLTFEASSHIVTVSDELRDLLTQTGVDPGKIRVVPNGVDVRRFGGDGPILPPGLDDKFVVGFVGSLKAWHGLEVLAEAFGSLATDPRFHLLIVGDGPMAPQMADLRDRFPCRVTLAGSVPASEVPAYLRAMHVAVAPYPPLERFYFSPIKLLEYMAAGRAIVASRIGQLRRLVSDGETGLLVEPGDAEALSRAVRRLADDDTLRSRLGDHAAREARRCHTWRHRAEEILALARAAA